MLSGRGTRRLVAVGGGLCLVATVLAALALASAGAAVAMGPESTGVPAATDSESTGAAADRHPQQARRVGPRIPAAMSASKAGGEITSWARPQDDLVHRIAEDRAGPGASAAEIDAEAEAFLAEWSATHYHGPDPMAHDALRYREDTLLEEGVTTQEAVSGTMRLLVIAVEFAGSDSVVDFSHEKGIRTGKCITETTTYTGPLHGQIPPPGPRDNNTYWAPSFDADFFTRMIFSTAGITERLRPELIDPEDGRAGIDISGLTMENFYQEVSGGRLSFDSGPRGPVAWVQVPHSVAYYSANACKNGRVAGRGLPANPNGESQLYTDLVAAVNSTYPDFPWADYDTDGDGILDHVELIHAGLDESGGGGVDGTNQIWAHRGSVGGGRGITVDDRGTPDDPDDDIRMRGYTIQPENLELGVLVHEFGHDLGLLDLYSTTGEESVIWWDLMSTGSNTGRLLGTDPTHMSAHTTWVLGWRDLEDISPNEDPVDYLLGQAAEPPEGTRPALKIDLPPSEISYTIPPGDSTQMWWSGADQNWADLTLGREVDLAGVTGPITFSFDTDYVIESDWDYMFVEASADGGQTYTQLKGYRVGTDEELTTPDNYPDPNGRLADYGGLKHGYTGDSRGWVRVYHDLTAYAGQQIHLRLRHATDAGFLERGAFLDNFRLQAGDTVVLDDPVEDDDTHGWTTLAGSFRGGAPGKGWRLSDGTDRFPRYYVLEWRNAVGFDTGLKYAYNTVHSGLTENN
ncbi:MAG: M6 family metalloprotease domain-containing protein, partial [Anaerolineae bacterium]